MEWYIYVAYFFGGVFFVNAIPHFVAGTMGSPFQSPFAKPPGKGLSSPLVNVLWGFFNFAVSYLLLGRIGEFNFHFTYEVLTVGAGALLMAVALALSFGPLHGGNI